MITLYRTEYEKDRAALRIALYDARKDPSTTVHWAALLADLVGEDRKARQLRYLAGKL